MVSREDDDRQPGALAFELARDLQTVHARQIDVQQNDIGAQHAGACQRAFAVIAGSDDSEIVFHFQRFLESVAEHGMVVDDEDAGWAGFARKIAVSHAFRRPVFHP